MSEFYKKARVLSTTSLLFSDFMQLCSFILSHPLYLSYFIFFSPYLLKLFSFLSPLFITVSLILLAVLTLSCPHESIIGKFLKAKTDDGKDEEESEDVYGSVELEAYKIVFETSTPEVIIKEEEDEEEDIKGTVEEAVTETAKVNVSIFHSCMGFDGIIDHPDIIINKCDSIIYEDNSDMGLTKSYLDEITDQPEIIKHITEEKITEFFKEEEKVSPPKISLETNKVGNYNEGKWENISQVSVVDQNDNNNLGSYGSMRREKEWKRTLACKLFEERHNVVDGGSGEGMDLLWETYETTDDNKVQEPSLTKNKVKKKQIEKNRSKNKNGGILDQWHEDEDEEEEDEIDNAQLCCLQALKLSSGKMNLGLGRPNLVKISKALKGIGWLHHVTTKHAKKSCN